MTAVPTPEQRVSELGIDISIPVPPIGTYEGVTIHNGFAYTSGIVALKAPDWDLLYAGRFGLDLSPEDAYQSARGAMLCTLANLRGALGSLDRVERILKVTGFVQSEPAVKGLPMVLDGATDLIGEIFGTDKLPARSAIGVYALPGGSSVEIECVVALTDS